MSDNEKVPLIGVTPGCAGPSEQREFCRTADIIYCDRAYLHCIESAGGIPVLLSHSKGRIVAETCQRIDGLLLTGGEDVHPLHYGHDVLFDNGTVSEVRDHFEIELISKFMETGKPILAICRGIQVLNVALGGTLFQDIPAQTGQHHHTQHAVTTVSTHQVQLVDTSQLSRAFGRQVVSVNSHHHQAVDQLAPELRAVGWSEEGIIEAVEHRTMPFLVGVQWHPERLAAKEPIQINVFKAFVDACRES